jgi:copper chaperone CopZ
LVLSASLIACFYVSSATLQAADKPSAPKQFRHQITGLFSPDREQDLREVFAKLPKFKLVSIDYKNAEAIVEYDPAKLWPGEKPERYLEIFHGELQNASRGTFGAKPLRTLPLEKLKWIEIPVEGLDCKGCSFAAYQMIYQLPGVETATASFKEGKVTALIDPAKTDRAKLEKALQQGGVQIKAATK